MEVNYSVMTEDEKTDMFTLLSNSSNLLSSTARTSLEARKFKATYEELTQEIAAVQTSLAQEKLQGEIERTHMKEVYERVQPGTLAAWQPALRGSH